MSLAPAKLILSKGKICAHAKTAHAVDATAKPIQSIVTQTLTLGRGRGGLAAWAGSIYDTPKQIPKMSEVSVIIVGMKKKMKPLSKTNNAIRKAHSAELFRSLLLNPHTIATPETRKGSRQANKRKAIAEHL